MATELHLTYFVKKSLEYGKYKGQIWAKVDGKGLGVMAEGTFPSVDAVKRWARDWARSKRAKLTIEKWR